MFHNHIPLPLGINFTQITPPICLHWYENWTFSLVWVDLSSSWLLLGLGQSFCTTTDTNLPWSDGHKIATLPWVQMGKWGWYRWPFTNVGRLGKCALPPLLYQGACRAHWWNLHDSDEMDHVRKRGPCRVLSSYSLSWGTQCLFLCTNPVCSDIWIVVKFLCHSITWICLGCNVFLEIQCSGSGGSRMHNQICRQVLSPSKALASSLVPQMDHQCGPSVHGTQPERWPTGSRCSIYE